MATPLDEALKKLCMIHNEIFEASVKEQELPDHRNREIAEFLANEFPKILFDSPRYEAAALVDAMIKKFPVPYLCNILTGIILYYFNMIDTDDLSSPSIDTETTIRDRLK